MFIELLRKEFIERKGASQTSKFSNILSYIIKLFFVSIFIGVQCFITLKIDSKLASNSHGSTYGFLVFYLFVVMLFGIIYSMEMARKVIYVKKDKDVLLPLPILSNDIIKAKMTYVYIAEVVFELIAAVPVLSCFGALHANFGAFYSIVVFYPLLISIFVVGVSLFLSIPYQYIFYLIKKNTIAQFLMATTIVVLLCLGYKYVLSMFLLALSNSDGLGAFSSEFVHFINNTSLCFVPVINLMEIAVKRMSIIPNLCVFLGMSLLSVLIGVSASSIFYPYFMKKSSSMNEKNKKHKNNKLKVESIDKTLLKKEIVLLFRDDTNMFSYTSLLVMVPLLSYIVVSTLNGIFASDLKYLMALKPELQSIVDIAIVLGFVTLVNNSACQSMSREGKNLALVKTIPVNIRKQILIKLSVPTIFSSASLAVADIILVASGNLNVHGFFYILLVGIPMIIWQSVFLMYADMIDLGPKKSHLTTYYTIYPILLIIMWIIIHFVVTMNASLFPIVLLYFIEIVIMYVLLGIFCVNIKKRFVKAFNEMEVIR